MALRKWWQFWKTKWDSNSKVFKNSDLKKIITAEVQKMVDPKFASWRVRTHFDRYYETLSLSNVEAIHADMETIDLMDPPLWDCDDAVANYLVNFRREWGNKTIGRYPCAIGYVYGTTHKDTSHMVAFFVTHDKKLKFVEPQGNMMIIPNPFKKITEFGGL